MMSWLLPTPDLLTLSCRMKRRLPAAHLVLQMRTQVLDERLEETFRDWYPDFRTKPPENEIQQAA
jgi:hypothetical protein